MGKAYIEFRLIDVTFICIRRVDHVSKEAYYTILGVRSDRTREVLTVVNFSIESVGAREEVFEGLKQRGMKQAGLFVCDGLTAIEDAIWKQFPEAEVQLCAIHIQRNIQKHIKPRHKSQVVEDLRDVFRTGDRNDSKEHGWKRWVRF